MLRRALEEQGYFVSFTPSLANARAVIERTKVDLLIANLLLPDGVSFEIADFAGHHAIPSFIMTGSVEHMAQLEGDGKFVLKKPFRLLDFLKEVKG